MHRNHRASFLLAGVTFFPAHAQLEPPSQQAAAEAPQRAVGPADPVITINGFCADPAMQGSACKTLVTRAQFDKLADALQPGMPVSLRLKVGNAYAHNLRMAAAAEARGLDKTPEFEEEMRFGRMQLLAQDLDRVLKAEANNISDETFRDHYEKNKSSFEQATVARIFVPHAKQLADGDTDEAHKKAAADRMTKLAADLRARAAQDENMDNLQIEAYSQAGIERTKADTKMEKVRRAALPPRHESIMDLKPGEVSEVFSDPEGAYFIYKMIARETLTLEQAKEEIRTAISTDRYRDSTKAFQGDVVFNDAYFNPPGKMSMPVVRGHKKRTDNPVPQEQ